MGDRYFDGYGNLEWLEPSEYYAEPWSFAGMAEDDNGEQFDIVVNRTHTEYRYSVV